MAKKKIINVQGTKINIISFEEADDICLTDMAKAKNDDSRAADVIKNWMRNRSTIEFLGTWEMINNGSNFKVVEFDHFKKEAGLPTFTMSVSDWVNSTHAKGIFSRKGKYGGTYAHKDIAFDFGSAINPTFKFYVIKEYQRLKKIETNQYNIEWDVKRIFSKANYHIQTDAIKNNIIPKTADHLAKYVYANEADLLNVVLFGCTAKQWNNANPKRVLEGGNIRDMASINELLILSNLENFNAILIKNNESQKDRFIALQEIVKEQRRTLDKMAMGKIIHEGEIILGETTIPCYVLENGTRVLSGNAIQK